MICRRFQKILRAQVGNERAFSRPFLTVINLFQNGGRQRRKPFLLLRRDFNQRKMYQVLQPFDIKNARQIAFRHDDERILSLKQGEDLLILRLQRPRTVKESEHERGAFHMRTRLLHADALDGILRRPYACRVDDPQRHAANIGILLNGITRRSRDVGDNSAIFAQQGIQEARLSHIRSSDNRRFQAVAQDASRMCRLQDAAQRRMEGRHLFPRLFYDNFIDALLGKINDGFQMGKKSQNILSHRAYALREMTGQMPRRHFQPLFRLRLHHVHDGLRLGQIKPAVQEGAFCELASFRSPRPVTIRQC